jgi:hypothetical protein
MFAVFLRQSESDSNVGLFVALCVGVAAGIVTFYGVLACSLAFAECG